MNSASQLVADFCLMNNCDAQLTSTTAYNKQLKHTGGLKDSPWLLIPFQLARPQTLNNHSEEKNKRKM